MKLHTMLKEATEMVTHAKFATESELALEGVRSAVGYPRQLTALGCS